MDPRVSTRGGYCVGFRDIFARLRVRLKGTAGRAWSGISTQGHLCFCDGILP